MTSKDSENHSKTNATKSGRSMDGLSRTGRSEKQASATAAGALHHKAQKPKTLMRDVVKRPKLSPKTALKPKMAANSSAAVLPVALAKERIDRAMSVPMSKFIKRFNDVAIPSKLVKRTAHVPVKAAPVEGITYHNSAPILQSPQQATTSSMLESAVQNSSSHNQKPIAKTKRRHAAARKLGLSKRLFTVSSATLAVLLIGGFFAYQNAPNAAFRMAASRAGVRASLPSYKPSGFAMTGPTQSAPGQITVRFQSNSDDRSFTVTQRSSNWNSSALLDNFVAVNRRSYQTLQDKGKTVYIYDDSNATWVDGGVWYQIEGNSSLSSDQLLNIASSM